MRWEKGCDFQTGRAISRDRSSLLMALLRPPIRHTSVDEARLDVSMTQVILDKIDRLAGVCVVMSISECTRRHVGGRPEKRSKEIDVAARVRTFSFTRGETPHREVRNH